MIVETTDRVICISQNRNSVLDEKSGKARVELEENLKAKHFVLSVEDNTSN